MKLCDERFDKNKKYPKPFLKWAGGKTQLLNVIENHLPKDIKECGVINKYFEPFVGGGAVFFHLYKNYEIKEAYLGDINDNLILTYNVIKNEPYKLINKLNKLNDEYLSKDCEEQKVFYYSIRSTFNNFLKNKLNVEKSFKPQIELASLFIFLNKTCFNGLYRVNKDGEFNVPFAHPKHPLICDKTNILSVSNALTNVKILNRDYSYFESLITEKSFVYLDPPYRPLNDKSFNNYSNAVFDDDEQIKLCDFFHRNCSKGANLLLSNSDPKNVDENDKFFDDLYSEYDIFRVDARRHINSKGNKRGCIKEILVSSF